MPNIMNVNEFYKLHHAKLSALNLFPIKGIGMVPVFNDCCPLCEKGWNNMDVNVIAIKDNFLYHAKCLRQKVGMDLPALIESKEIIEGLAD